MPPMSAKTLQLILFIILLTPGAFAEQFWNSNSLSLLEGNHYRVGDKDRSIITFEHASGHSWGDVFLFVDRLKSNDGTNETYMEMSPRYSFGKNGLLNLEDGFVKDVLIAMTAEMGQNPTSSFDHYLIGPGFDIAMPGFSYFQWNLYRRNNDQRDDGWQLTQAWGLPFEIGEQKFLYDGFFDWVSATDDSAPSLNFTSQLKWDLGSSLGLTDKPLYLGFEFVYWENKFGIRDTPLFRTNERNTNLLLKAHF